MARPRKLYTIYRNSDDAIVLFDATADQCCEFLGVQKESFYSMFVRHGGNKAYTITSVSAEQAKRDKFCLD